jgi:MFS family permease
MKKIYYGWYIVAAAFILMVYNSAMFVYGFTAFINPISASYGWTLAEISLASSIRGLETGVLDPFIGMAADRWPARILVIAGTALFTLGIFCFTFSSSLVLFYIGFFLVGIGSSTAIAVVPTTVISRWFKNVGKANGILAAGIAVGGLFAPLLVKGLDAFGWQVSDRCFTILCIPRSPVG